MNISTSISTTLDSKITTGFVVVGYASLMGHAYLHPVQKKKSSVCELPVFIFCIGTAVAGNVAAYYSGKMAYRFAAAVIGSIISVGPVLDSVLYQRGQKPGELLDKIYDISKALGMIGFLLSSIHVQIRVINHAVFKITSTQIIHKIPVKLICGIALYFINNQAVVYLYDLAHRKIVKLELTPQL